MKNKKNSIFLIVVPILCILIVALFAYDRYQTNQLAKKFKQDNQTVDTSKNNNQTSLENKLPTIYCVGDAPTKETTTKTPRNGEPNEKRRRSHHNRWFTRCD